MNGENLRKRRKQMGMEMQVLAEKLGTTRTSVSRWETGVNEPDDETKNRLADILNTTTDYLMGRTDDPSSDRQPASVSIPWSMKILSGRLPDDENRYWILLPDEIHKMEASAEQHDAFCAWFDNRTTKGTLALAATLGVPVDWLIPPDPDKAASVLVEDEETALLVLWRSLSPEKRETALRILRAL